MFGTKDDADDDVATLTAEIERVDGLSLTQLGVEVMRKGFGPDGPGGPGKPGSLEDLTTMTFPRLDVLNVAREFTPALSGRKVGRDLQRRFVYLISEGLQVLENAALVRVNWQGGQMHWIATRRGRTALATNSVEQALGS